MKNLFLTLFAIFVYIVSFSQCENDSINPYFVNFEPEITISCDIDLSVIFPVALDECDDSVEVAWYQEITSGICENNYDIFRVYRAFDNFGNQSVESQMIHVVDETSPMFTPFENLTVDCGDTIVFDDPQVTDNCSDFALTSYDIISQIDSCTTNYIRVWQAIDFCGNTSTRSQTIISTDLTPPSIMGPIYLEVGDVSDLDSVFVNTSDNCSQVTLTYVDTDYSGNNVIRIYTATDNCGNVSEFEQIIHVNTIIPPGDDDDDDDDDDHNRVAICHREGNGSYHTIYVSQNAVQAHLNHGDYLGPCTEIVVDWQSILPNSDLQMMIIKGKDNKFKKFVKTK
jgi:hypothetical protein